MSDLLEDLKYTLSERAITSLKDFRPEDPEYMRQLAEYRHILNVLIQKAPAEEKKLLFQLEDTSNYMKGTDLSNIYLQGLRDGIFLMKTLLL